MKNIPTMNFKIYTSDKILIVVKLIRMRWEEHVVRTGLGRGAYRLLVEKLKGKRTLERRGIDVRTILQSILKKQNRAMDWIDLALDRDRWRVLVNTLINFRVLYNVENFLTS
jgi:hypothetical protein